MSRSGWRYTCGALIVACMPVAAQQLVAPTTWQADLGTVASVPFAQDGTEHLPLLFDDETALVLGPNYTAGIIGVAAVDPSGTPAQSQWSLHVEPQRWIIAESVVVTGAQHALVNLRIWRSSGPEGYALAAVDRQGRLGWSRNGPIGSAVANADGSFWLPRSTVLERVAADGRTLAFVEVGPAEWGRSYVGSVLASRNRLVVLGSRVDFSNEFLEARDRASGARLWSVTLGVPRTQINCIAANDDFVYLGYRRDELTSPPTVSYRIEIRSAADGAVVGTGVLPGTTDGWTECTLYPLSAGGVLWLREDGYDQVLHATAVDGSLRWQRRIEAVRDGLVAVSEDGMRIALAAVPTSDLARVRLHALDPASGATISTADFTSTANRAQFALRASSTGWVLARPQARAVERLRLDPSFNVVGSHHAEGALFVARAAGSALVDERLLVATEVDTSTGRAIRMEAYDPISGTLAQEALLQPLPISAASSISWLSLSAVEGGLLLHATVQRPWGEPPCPSLIVSHVLMLDRDTLQERWRRSMLDTFTRFVQGREGDVVYFIGADTNAVTCTASPPLLQAWDTVTGAVRWSTESSPGLQYLRASPGRMLAMSNQDLAFELESRASDDGRVLWRSPVADQSFARMAPDVVPGRLLTQEESILGNTVALAARNELDGHVIFRTVLDFAPDYAWRPVAPALTDGRLLFSTTRSVFRGQLVDGAPYIAVLDPQAGGLTHEIDPGRLPGYGWQLRPIWRSDGRVPVVFPAVSTVTPVQPGSYSVLALTTVDAENGVIGGDRLLHLPYAPVGTPRRGWQRFDQMFELSDGSLLLLGVRFDDHGIARRSVARIESEPPTVGDVRIAVAGLPDSTVGYDVVFDVIVTNQGPGAVDGIQLRGMDPVQSTSTLAIEHCSVTGTGACPAPGDLHEASLSLGATSTAVLKVRMTCLVCEPSTFRRAERVELSATLPFDAADIGRVDNYVRSLLALGPFRSDFE
jgi:hypothetical protein